MLPVPNNMDENDLPLWSRFNSVVNTGASDQKEDPNIFNSKYPYLPLSTRADVLVFQTNILNYDIEITGPINVTIWASSTAIDTDFTVKLVDVYPVNEDFPQGYAMNLSDSIIRARFRNNWEKERFMNTGEIYEFKIIMNPISNLFLAGHRIRLDVSSSNFPRFDVNPNTGEPVGKHTHTITACNTIYFNVNNPSHIELPLIVSE